MNFMVCARPAIISVMSHTSSLSRSKRYKKAQKRYKKDTKNSMFSKPAQPSGELETLINKATDPTLTSDNWQFILDVCDNISKNPESLTKQAIQIISARLNTKDANVLLRTLSLVTAVAENCGSRMKQEIATKSFLNDSLIKKLSDRKIHKVVKHKVYDTIMQLNSSFKTDPSLKPMSDAANSVRKDYHQFSKGEDGPSKPAKKELSESDKQKEEEDFERVLKLSLQEYERDRAVKKAYLNDKPLPNTVEEATKPVPKQDSGDEGQTIATISKVRALYDLISYEPDELSFRKGDVITVIESVFRDWWRGSLPSGKVGIFPLNYVTPVVNKTSEELNKEAEAENNVLFGESRKVDQLLGLLSSNNGNLDEDEITRLYNEVLPLRPLLAKSIDKYGVRKEELMDMNGQLNGQIKYFNELVDTSMNSRINHAPQYQQYSPYPKEGNDFMPMQPTSNGFGNGSEWRPPQSQSNLQPPQQDYPQQPHSSQLPPQHTQQYHSQHPQPTQPTHPQQPPHPSQPYPNQTYPPYSNVNNFPSVNDL